jgi:hypothetical protein
MAPSEQGQRHVAMKSMQTSIRLDLTGRAAMPRMWRPEFRNPRQRQLPTGSVQGGDSGAEEGDELPGICLIRPGRTLS